MEGVRDSTIKLFGKEIALPENGRIPVISGGVPDGDFVEEDSRYKSSLKAMSAGLEDERVRKTGEAKQGRKEEEEEEHETDKDSQFGIFTENKPSNSPLPTEEEDTIMKSEEHPKTSPVVEESESEEKQDTEDDQNGATNPGRKTLRKPDKILPCPRCNSMDTKFCYYNNYNVNQPRHFCKGCQRYWTAGGAMRNVPVGAGRRKSKNSGPHCRHIAISEAVQAAPVDALDGAHRPPCGNGVVLSFQNGIYKAEGENGSDSSTGSSVTTNSSSFEVGIRNYQSGTDGSGSRVQCLQGFPWTYPSIPNPGFCPLGYPIPVYPVPYWNCSVPGPWPLPWLPPQPPNPVAASPLGKHSRNGELLGPNNLEKKGLEEPKSEISILMPKTLRIDDPDEAAKSSIWATLGIKNDGINRNAILKAFEPKGDEKKNYVPKTPSSLRANPAAMSRSQEFHETA